MKDDLIARLRAFDDYEAADRIEALTAEIERLHERILELTTLTGRDKLTAELETAKASRDQWHKVACDDAGALAAMTKERDEAIAEIARIRSKWGYVNPALKYEIDDFNAAAKGEPE